MSDRPYDYTIRDLEVVASDQFKRRLRDTGGKILLPSKAGDAFWMAAYEALEKFNAVAHGNDVVRHVSWTTLEQGCTPRIHLIIHANVYVLRRRMNHSRMEVDFRERIKALLKGKHMTDMDMTAHLAVVARDTVHPEPIEVLEPEPSPVS